jgi:hypothetical protein
MKKIIAEIIHFNYSREIKRLVLSNIYTIFKTDFLL